MQAGSGGEHARRLADQAASQPQAVGAIEEVLQRCGHVAEASWAAQGKTGTVLQFIEGGIESALLGNAWRDRFAFSGHRWHGTQTGFQAGLFHAAGDMPGHVGSGAVAAVIQHQNVGRAHARISRTFSGRRRTTALSPATRIGRSISFGWDAMASISCASVRVASARLSVLYSSSPVRSNCRALRPSLA